MTLLWIVDAGIINKQIYEAKIKIGIKYKQLKPTKKPNSAAHAPELNMKRALWALWVI